MRKVLELPQVQFAILGLIVLIGVGVPLAIVGLRRLNSDDLSPQCAREVQQLEHVRNVPTEQAGLYHATLDWARAGCDPATYPSPTAQLQ